VSAIHPIARIGQNKGGRPQVVFIVEIVEIVETVPTAGSWL
jgi:hypothetical protein